MVPGLISGDDIYILNIHSTIHTLINSLWKIFSINSNDVYDLPFLWFRDNCQCDECRIKETQEKQFLLNTVPLGIKPVKALEAEDSFLITWEDSHQTIIPFEVINNSLQSRYPKHQSWPKNFTPKKIDWDSFLNEKTVC